MILRKVVLDTNVYVDWLNEKRHEPFVLAPGFVRYLAAVVQMELRAGARTRRARQALDQLVAAYRVSKRIVVPGAGAFDQAGRTLRALRDRGVEVGRASIVNDVLIAHCARAIGATVITRDSDFGVIREVLDFDVQVIDTCASVPRSRADCDDECCCDDRIACTRDPWPRGRVLVARERISNERERAID